MIYLIAFAAATAAAYPLMEYTLNSMVKLTDTNVTVRRQNCR